MFWNSKKSPITIEDQEWLEQSFLRLASLFGVNQILEYETILPGKKYFNWNFTGSESDAEESLKIVCEIMKVDFSKVSLEFY